MYLHEVVLTTEYPLERIWAETWSEIWSRQTKKSVFQLKYDTQNNRDWLTSKRFLLNVTNFLCILDPNPSVSKHFFSAVLFGKESVYPHIFRPIQRQKENTKGKFGSGIIVMQKTCLSLFFQRYRSKLSALSITLAFSVIARIVCVTGHVSRRFDISTFILSHSRSLAWWIDSNTFHIHGLDTSTARSWTL